jgi:hypothetical protein
LLKKGVVDELRIGFYHDDRSALGEFCVRWIDLADRVIPQLCAYDDAWSTLANMPEFIALLDELNDADMTIAAFAERLVTLGFADLTPYTHERPWYEARKIHPELDSLLHDVDRLQAINDDLPPLEKQRLAQLTLRKADWAIRLGIAESPSKEST